MQNKIQRFISSTVSYHDFEEAVNIANDLNCGLEISRFGRLADIEDNFEINELESIIENKSPVATDALETANFTGLASENSLTSGLKYDKE